MGGVLSKKKARGEGGSLEGKKRDNLGLYKFFNQQN